MLRLNFIELGQVEVREGARHLGSNRIDALVLLDERPNLSFPVLRHREPPVEILRPLEPELVGFGSVDAVEVHGDEGIGHLLEGRR